jgi:hypothetical protein
VAVRLIRNHLVFPHETLPSIIIKTLGKAKSFPIKEKTPVNTEILVTRAGLFASLMIRFGIA